MTYHSIVEVLADRRKGVALDEVIDSLLMTPHVWQIHGLTPFSIIPQLYKTDFVDMSTDNWRSLPVELQMELSRGYQQWYAHHMGLIEPEKTFTDGVEIKMRLIPPMKYWMGAPEAEVGTIPNEKQKLKLIQKPFWMGTYTITQAQWSLIMPQNLSRFEAPENPITNFEMVEVQEFCRKTNTKLPKEAEWELACRAGTTTIFSFGSDSDELNHYAIFARDIDAGPTSVGKKNPNAFGLYDMHGNIWNIIDGQYSPDYQYALRGGAYYSSEIECRSYSRNGCNNPNHIGSILGFRVCKKLEVFGLSATPR